MPWTEEQRRKYNRQYYLEHRDKLLPLHRESIKRWREKKRRRIRYKILFESHKDNKERYWVASGRLGRLGSVITQGKNFIEACRNLSEALALAVESFGESEKSQKMPRQRSEYYCSKCGFVIINPKEPPVIKRICPICGIQLKKRQRSLTNGQAQGL